MQGINFLKFHQKHIELRSIDFIPEAVIRCLVGLIVAFVFLQSKFIDDLACDCCRVVSKLFDDLELVVSFGKLVAPLFSHLLNLKLRICRVVEEISKNAT